MELWKQLVYDGVENNSRFEISSLGRLRNKLTGHIYKVHLNNEGYFQVNVSLGSRNNKKVIKIHRAVAIVFCNGYSKDLLVNHKDGDKTNNVFDNLEWVTNKENVIHAINNNLVKLGSDRSNSKLSKNDIDYIRNNFNAKTQSKNAKALAKKFNIHVCNIYRVINKITYSHQ